MNKKGFTLVELLISLTILAFLFSATFYSFGVGLKIWKNNLKRIKHSQIASLVLERIKRDVHSASEILPSSNRGTLVLRIGMDNICYQLINRKVCRLKNGFSNYLTNEDEINQLAFSYPSVDLVAVQVDDFVTQVAIRN